MSLPNTLTIYINTTIPGHQFFKYQPSNTIPNSQSKIVLFDPIIKLNQNIINQTPQNDKMAQFFEKNLFKTLIIRTEQFQPIRSIQQSVKEGIIDNNIIITLNNIFKSNNLFYINKTPYTIFSSDWETGNWKIDTKINTPSYNYSNINSPLNREIIQTQINNANKELNKLPENIIKGDSYKEPINLSESINSNSNSKSKSIEFPKKLPLPKDNIINKQSNNTQLVIKPKNQVTLFSEKQNDIPQNKTKIPSQKNLIADSELKEPSSNLKQISQGNDNSNIQLIKNNILIPVPPELSSEEPILNSKKHNNTKLLRNYLKNSNFRSMIINIFNNFSQNEQAVLKEIIKNFTKKNPITLSIDSYKDSVDSLHIIPNSGGGNCLYISIADAINRFNDNKPLDPIKYLEFGTNKPFTQIVIRTIVANELINNQNILDNAFESSKSRVEIMNQEFDSEYSDSMTETMFFSLIDYIYNKGDNFLVSKPKSFNKDSIKKPFSTITNKNEIIDYILSNSWGDARVLKFVQKGLGLLVIPIEFVDETQKFRIPFVDLQMGNSKNDENDDNVGNDENDDKINKYMFVYLSGNHFEEITFDFYFKKKLDTIQNIKTKNETKSKKSISIFDINDQIIIVPIYILFILFGSYFFILNEDSQKNVKILFNYLNAINISFEKIISQPINKNNFLFIKNFLFYFPSNKAQTEFNQMKLAMDELNVSQLDDQQGGGEKINYNLDKTVNLSYYITITLDLYEGTSIPNSEKPNIICRQNLNNLKKSWADLLGYKYSSQPYYTPSYVGYIPPKQKDSLKKDSLKKKETMQKETMQKETLKQKFKSKFINQTKKNK